MLAVLPLCVRNRTRIVTNMGAANPVAAMEKTREVARSLGLHGLRIAAVTGDDVLTTVESGGLSFLENELPVQTFSDRLVSANAYLGAETIVAALSAGADVVLMYEFGWSATDWNLLGQGTVVGHLLECGGQVTGGYFADPGHKDVSGLARLGFPIAEVTEDGAAVITKVDGSGGMVTRATCTEQLLYEIQDPAAYPTPDVVADFSQVKLDEVGRDRVLVTGGLGRPRPESLKASVGYLDGYVGEGQISYAGLGALQRAKLARDILAERLRPHFLQELRFDFIGLNSIHGDRLSRLDHGPYEVRLRATGRAVSMREAAIIPREVEALYTNGPAGGGGVTGFTKETIAILSTLIPRKLVNPHIQYEES